jgi:WD40 repeat protein
MSGTLTLVDATTREIVDSRLDHAKYVVRMAKFEVNDGFYIATAGWDGRVFVYHLSSQYNDRPKLNNPIATLDLPTNPECLLFIEHPESDVPALLLTRRDSTFLYYFAIPIKEPGSASASTKPAELHNLGRQNLAPYSNSWVAYTPSYVALSPKDPSLVAVATSTTPHMKLLVVRLLIPPKATGTSSTEEHSPARTQASQNRASLALQGREEAAILLSCNTFAPQTQYSTPILAWRPDGTGVWVSADDGAIRGIETASGKTVATLQGHEQDSRVRSLWAGLVEYESSKGRCVEEWLVSGGFDRRLIIWRPH